MWLRGARLTFLADFASTHFFSAGRWVAPKAPTILWRVRDPVAASISRVRLPDALACALVPFGTAALADFLRSPASLRHTSCGTGEQHSQDQDQRRARRHLAE